MFLTRLRCLIAAFLLVPALAGAGVLESIFPDGFEDGTTHAWEYELNINNYLAWCSVTVGEESPNTSETIIRYFMPGTVVVLYAEPLNPFVWGYWVGTDGDNGSHDTAQTTAETMVADSHIQACCPFSGQDCGPFP